MYTNLISETKTVRDRQDLKDELEMLAKSLYETGDLGFEQVLKSKVRDRVASVIRKDTTVEGVDKANYLKSALAEIDKLEVVKMTLGFEPTGVSIDKFRQYATNVLGQNVLLDTTYQKELVGGVIVEWRGEYRDYSLKRLLEGEFDRQGSNLLGQVVKNDESTTSTPTAGKAK